ncbi:hypothetical protein HXX76_002413 [Chlamydomonas incerta]|uniref:Uncharacterized protein n=1 Tax=Chlamydomonas incerta TaxID=51695 RepID=A0A835TBA2_CHLIN|nr:hypothetical protein HXX76_002413 [Chlamydomonas incerta]|eukprot:KAG2442327.1 hypothetical protein HXX76_002413 [Chlamydomonas incerta]
MDVETRLAELRDEYERSRAFLAQLEMSRKEPEPEAVEACRVVAQDSSVDIEDDSVHVSKLDANPASPRPQADELNADADCAGATSPVKKAQKGLGSRFTGWIKNKLAPGGHDSNGHDAGAAVARSAQSCTLPSRRRASFATINLDFGGALGGMGGVAVAPYSPGGTGHTSSQLSHPQVPQGAPSPGGANSPAAGIPSPSGGSFTLPAAAGGRGRAPVSRRSSFIAAAAMRASISASNQVHPHPGGGNGGEAPPPRARAEEDGGACGGGDGGGCNEGAGGGALTDTDENGAAVVPRPAAVASGRLSGVLPSNAVGAGALGSAGPGPSALLPVAPDGAPPARRFPLRRSSLGDMGSTATGGAVGGSSRGLVPSGARRASLDIQRPVVLRSPHNAGSGAAAEAVAVPDELTEVQPHFLPLVHSSQAQQQRLQQQVQHLQPQQQQQQQQQHSPGDRRCFASEQQVWVTREGSGGPGPALASTIQARADPASGTSGAAAAHAASASGAHVSCSGVGSSGTSTRFSGVPAMSGAGTCGAGGGAHGPDVDDPMIAAAAAAYWSSTAAAEAAKDNAAVTAGVGASGGQQGYGFSSPGAGDGGSSSRSGPQQQQHYLYHYQPPHASSPQHYVGAAAAEPAAAAAAAAAAPHGGGSTTGSLRFSRLTAAPPHALGVPGTGLAAARSNSTRPGGRSRRLSFEAYAASASPLGPGAGPYDGTAARSSSVSRLEAARS